MYSVTVHIVVGVVHGWPNENGEDDSPDICCCYDTQTQFISLINGFGWSDRMHFHSAFTWYLCAIGNNPRHWRYFNMGIHEPERKSYRIFALGPICKHVDSIETATGNRTYISTSKLCHLHVCSAWMVSRMFRFVLDTSNRLKTHQFLMEPEHSRTLLRRRTAILSKRPIQQTTCCAIVQKNPSNFSNPNGCFVSSHAEHNRIGQIVLDSAKLWSDSEQIQFEA